MPRSVFVRFGAFLLVGTACCGLLCDQFDIRYSLRGCYLEWGKQPRSGGTSPKPLSSRVRTQGSFALCGARRGPRPRPASFLKKAGSKTFVRLQTVSKVPDRMRKRTPIVCQRPFLLHITGSGDQSPAGFGAEPHYRSSRSDTT